MSEKKEIYDAEMFDTSANESLGSKPITGEPETLKEATREANEVAGELSEVIGDTVEARNIHAE